MIDLLSPIFLLSSKKNQEKYEERAVKKLEEKVKHV